MTDYYPGSRRPVKALLKREEPELEGGRTFKTPRGELTLFSIGELAMKLNRSAATVRRWEREGIIPKATFKKPGKDNNAHGRRRLYSKDQIIGLVKIAEEEGILDNPKAAIVKTRFSTKALNLFKELQGK